MTSRRPKPTPWTACASCTTATSARRLPWPRWLRSIEAHLHGHRGRPLHGGQQLAASGGLYIEEGSTRLACDPGPGAVVQYAKRKVDLARLDGILVSHRHLDHCGDVNVMVEAMTEGGFRSRGKLYCPGDALDDDPVVLRYLRSFPDEVVRLQASTA